MMKGSWTQLSFAGIFDLKGFENTCFFVRLETWKNFVVHAMKEEEEDYMRLKVWSCSRSETFADCKNFLFWIQFVPPL